MILVAGVIGVLQTEGLNSDSKGLSDVDELSLEPDLSVSVRYAKLAREKIWPTHKAPPWFILLGQRASVRLVQWGRGAWLY